jgi:hypothetical protein
MSMSASARHWQDASRDVSRLVNRFIEQRSGELERLRGNMAEKLKAVLVPFGEEDEVFRQPGKKKELEIDGLLELRPRSFYRLDILSSSERLLSSADIEYLKRALTSYHRILADYTVRDDEAQASAKKGKQVLPRTGMTSLRLHAERKTTARLAAEGSLRLPPSALRQGGHLLHHQDDGLPSGGLSRRLRVPAAEREPFSARVRPSLPHHLLL